jgi:hypothetical protein
MIDLSQFPWHVLEDASAPGRNQLLAEQTRDQYATPVLKGKLVFGPRSWLILLHSHKRISLLAPVTK